MIEETREETDGNGLLLQVSIHTAAPQPQAAHNIKGRAMVADESVGLSVRRMGFGQVNVAEDARRSQMGGCNRARMAVSALSIGQQQPSLCLWPGALEPVACSLL
ncbi:hypothetical protein RRF57_007839 [Xylaria bambusicola]|uniref:Uncharacterized protein n=1 Tax=Xylaria bambusicola TaxID=326684 RepID=A0AAN7UGT6_9PEZI